MVVGAAVFAASAFGRRKVFVSFDYENDKHYKFLLSAWSANNEFEFRFDDRSSGEVQTADVGRVKAALTTKIRDADVLLVLIGREANTFHPDWRQIGYRNWINFEIAQAKESGKKVVAVKLDRFFESPEQLDGAGAIWAMAYTDEAVSKALRLA